MQSKFPDTEILVATEQLPGTRTAENHFHLLRLPPELRNKIYELVIPRNGAINATQNYRFKTPKL